MPQSNRLFPLYALELLEDIAEIPQVIVLPKPIRFPYLTHKRLYEIECSETNKDDQYPISRTQQCRIALGFSYLFNDTIILFQFFFDDGQAAI
jgi:hypothetical protein